MVCQVELDFQLKQLLYNDFIFNMKFSGNWSTIQKATKRINQCIKLKSFEFIIV